MNPEQDIHEDYRSRRLIANSNERRRMANINAALRSIRGLLPASMTEKDKLSKAIVLQETANYVAQLKQEKSQLKKDNSALREALALSQKKLKNLSLDSSGFHSAYYSPEASVVQFSSTPETSDGQFTSSPETSDVQFTSSSETSDVQFTSSSETSDVQFTSSSETSDVQFTSSSETSDDPVPTSPQSPEESSDAEVIPTPSTKKHSIGDLTGDLKGMKIQMVEIQRENLELCYRFEQEKRHRIILERLLQQLNGNGIRQSSPENTVTTFDNRIIFETPNCITVRNNFEPEVCLDNVFLSCAFENQDSEEPSSPLAQVPDTKISLSSGYSDSGSPTDTHSFSLKISASAGSHESSTDPLFVPEDNRLSENYESTALSLPSELFNSGKNNNDDAVVPGSTVDHVIPVKNPDNISAIAQSEGGNTTMELEFTPKTASTPSTSTNQPSLETSPAQIKRKRGRPKSQQKTSLWAKILRRSE